LKVVARLARKPSHPYGISGASKHPINVRFPVSISAIPHPPLANGLVLDYDYDKAGA